MSWLTPSEQLTIARLKSLFFNHIINALSNTCGLAKRRVLGLLFQNGMIMTARSAIPSLQSLIAFICVAEQRSFTRAADLLCLTQGAVSKQVGSLEVFLGVDLFSRTREGLVLTRQGEKYLLDIKPHMEGLSLAGQKFIGPKGSIVPLRVRGLATLNDRWLLPRIGRFMDQYPGIRIEFSTVLLTTSHPVANVEIEIRFGSGEWADVESQYLVGEECVLVTSQAFLVRHGSHSSVLPQNVLAWPRCEHMQALEIWQEFMTAYGLRHEDMSPAAGTHEVYSVLISSVVNGLAAGLVPRCLIEAELSAGTLINPGRLRLKSASGYYVCWPRKTPLRSEAAAFVKWLLKEARTITAVSGSAHP
jgi:LysR family transcriptional regulator, glycine cleavage system transcriptional activator